MGRNKKQGKQQVALIILNLEKIKTKYKYFQEKLSFFPFFFFVLF